MLLLVKLGFDCFNWRTVERFLENFFVLYIHFFESAQVSIRYILTQYLQTNTSYVER